MTLVLRREVTIELPLGTMPPPTAALALAQPWAQSYDPAHHWLLSAVWAALPLLVLLIFMGGLRLKGHIAALAGMAAALLIALLVFRMPASMALLATGYWSSLRPLPRLLDRLPRPLP